MGQAERRNIRKTSVSLSPDHFFFMISPTKHSITKILRDNDSCDPAGDFFFNQLPKKISFRFENDVCLCRMELSIA